ncbi:hypothetical protein WN944_022236 [Citrus x changshan-huyou]|uniref:AAA+ ATPase domain-containing protein n=1 Tax=Citrus x changshan-huyou TaxID=2935761 RepID=A0AAP0MY55_9ROSI
MGNFCSPSFSCDSTISQCLDCTDRKAGYLCHLEDNLEAVEKELQRLIEVRNDVKIRVMVAEQQQQMKQLEQVQGWFSRVQDVIKEVEKLIRESPQEVERLCLGGFCSNSCKSSYKFGKKLVKTLREMQSLRIEGDFKEVAQPQAVPENPVDERPLPPTVVGLESTMDKVWRCITEERVGIIGLYGMGGVGKTTLPTQINNQFISAPNNFDFVIWVVVSKDLQHEKIQESIAKKIGLFNESWKSKSLQEKAQEIFKIMSNKKFVLLLDDIWELVDLAQVGLPIPSRTSASNKVIFTTREYEVCGQMEVHRSFKVNCLQYEDAWKLFEEKVGSETLDSDPNIPELAETVCKECGGLPLALITVGRAMASGKHLESGNMQLSLFPEDHKISVEDLIDCWICEEILDEYDGLGARNRGYSIIRTLLHACLLEEEEDDCVKMHDVIRDMALWIPSTIDNEKEKFLVLAGVGLVEAPGIRMWTDVTRMSLMENRICKISRSPDCPLLRTLFLNSNDFDMVNNDLFQSMASLRVLKLSNNFQAPFRCDHLLLEVEIDYAAGELKKIREIRGFHSLQNIYISDCKLKHLTWLVLAPNLKRLKISSCCNLEEIISAERLAEANENLIPFGRLEYLILEGLNHLKSIHSTALPFPHLKEISVRGCAELKRLPLDCNSGLERKIVIRGPRFWWHQLQWDDLATEYAFLPCFQTNF